MRFNTTHDAQAISALRYQSTKPRDIMRTLVWLQTPEADKVLIDSAQKTKCIIDKIKAP